MPSATDQIRLGSWRGWASGRRSGWPLTPAGKLLLGVALAICLSGCATVVESDLRDREAVLGASTWSFLANRPEPDPGRTSPRRMAAYRVRAPARDPRRIDRALVAAIEFELIERGYERVEGDADLYVDFHLVLDPRLENVKVPLTARTVYSFSDQPSYTFEGTTLEPRVREYLTLDVELRTSEGRLLWTGRLERVFERLRDVPVFEIVERVMRPIESRGG